LGFRGSSSIGMSPMVQSSILNYDTSMSIFNNISYMVVQSSTKSIQELLAVLPPNNCLLSKYRNTDDSLTKPQKYKNAKTKTPINI
jgi:hypothetical protein